MTPRRQLSPRRKGVYYTGLGLATLGGLIFASCFVSFALHFGDFSMGVNFGRSMAIRGFGGMALIVLGMILAGLGRAGAAGSGIVLDPEKARRDVEPWSRMQGGMAKDALDEAGISLGASSDRRINHLPLDEQLRRLYQLRDDGIITEDEYTSKKRQILERM